MEIDYTIGDEIVCVRTHELGIIKEGQVFTCLGLKKPSCKCNVIEVNIGINVPKDCQNDKQLRCTDCKTPMLNDGIWWFHSRRFRGMQHIDISEAIECLNVKEEVIKKLNQ